MTHNQEGSGQMKIERYAGGRGGVISLEYQPGIDPPLAHCPSCGCAGATIVNTHTASYWVECPCGAENHGGVNKDGRSLRAHRSAFLSAIEAWNRRAKPKQAEAAERELIKALARLRAGIAALPCTNPLWWCENESVALKPCPACALKASLKEKL